MGPRSLLLAAALLALLASMPVAAASSCTPKFIMYGDPRCPHCRANHEALETLEGTSLAFIIISSNETGAEEYLWYWRTYIGLPGYAIPLTVVKLCGETKAVVVGERPREWWVQLLSKISVLREQEVLVCIGGDCRTKARVEEPWLHSSLSRAQAAGEAVEAEERESLPLPLLAAALVGLALIDSINPCFMALYAGLLAVVAATGGRRRALALGASITLGVYAGYYLLGLGLSQLISLLQQWLRPLLVAGLVALAAYNISGLARAGSGGGGGCKICNRVSGGSLAAGLGFGLASSLTLLPCTAGPYVAAVTLLASQPLVARLSLLALYNLVFVAPLALLALGASWATSLLASGRGQAITRLLGSLALLILALLLAIGVV